jgi:signal transduction histidine kinase
MRQKRLPRPRARTVRIETSYSQGDGVVRLRVSDDGPGIAPELEGSLFKKRVSSKPAGHGFGLLTILRIVKDHGGNVTAGPRDGGGAEFTIELPADPEQHIAESGLADGGNTLNG